MSDLFDGFLEIYAAIGYWALFLIIMLENAGLPLPGQVALLIAGYLASSDGGNQLDLRYVLMASCAGAFVGDSIGYWLGRFLARRRLARGKRFLLLTPERFRHVERYFERYGAATVFFGRFFAVLRIIGGPAAGAAGMNWWRFLFANAGGAVLWASAITLLGYYAGDGWQTMHRWLGRGTWAVLAGIVILVVCWSVRRRLRER